MASLQSLPLELILLITDYLSPDGCPTCADPYSRTICHSAYSAHADQTCLALTCRGGYRINDGLPRSNYNLTKIELLSHLGERGMWPSEILCHSCEKFHTPRKGLQVAEDEVHRSCVKQGSVSYEMESFSQHLPRHIHFDLVAAVARSYQLRLEPPLYPLSLLSSSESTLGDNVLTSWKDLGKGKSRKEQEWQAHLDEYNRLDEERHVLGEVAREVEDLTVCDESGSSESRIGCEAFPYTPPTYYYPTISDRRIRRAFHVSPQGDSW
ncbi:hypothetical protein FGRMN_6443 [Fusarium graminum]|nr:hypothetical protein FGRMN_6443 [Fusarium graminum]